MWFWIWSALVVATLVGAFFLGRSLWRKVKVLLRALDGLSSAAADAPSRVEERIAATVATTPRSPDVFRDRNELLPLVAARRAARRERAASRRAQHAPRYAAWRDLDR